jgi:hypothetical protein
MSKDSAVSTAQSALRLRHDVTCNNAGTIWTWKKFGWKVVMWDNGTLIAVIDTWNMGR